MCQNNICCFPHSFSLWFSPQQASCNMKLLAFILLPILIQHDFVLSSVRERVRENRKIELEFLELAKKKIRSVFEFSHTKILFKQIKILRWECNTTGLIWTKPECRVRSLSRTKQIVSLGYELVKKVDKVYVSFFPLSSQQQWTVNSLCFRFNSLFMAAAHTKLILRDEFKCFYSADHLPWLY